MQYNYYSQQNRRLESSLLVQQSLGTLSHLPLLACIEINYLMMYQGT